MSLIPLRCLHFQFHCPLLTPLFLIYHFAAFSSLSLPAPASVEVVSTSPLLTLFWPLGSCSAFARMFTHITDKLFGLISESGTAIRMVYLIWCWGKQICHYFYVIKKDSHGSAFHLYSVPKTPGRLSCNLLSSCSCLDLTCTHAFSQ